jgi:hypothetical protein
MDVGLSEKFKHKSYFKMLNRKGGTLFLKRCESPTPRLGKYQ